MNTSELEAFIKICEYGSIRKAAEILFVSPQALSKMIKKLEAELGVILLERDSKGVKPTLYGKRLAFRAKRIIKELESIRNDNHLSVDLTIAATFGILAYLGIDFINDFKDQYPNIDLQIHEAPDNRIKELITNEQAAIGFLAGPIEIMKYNAKFYTSHRHCLVINKDHPLAKKEFITYADLHELPIALEGREFMPYHNNINRFIKAGVTPKIVMETTEIEFLHQIANENKAIGLSVDFPAFKSSLKNIVIRPFEDQECTWDVYLVTKKGIDQSNEAALFYEFALKWLSQHKHELFEWNPY
ncbi:LysR family transcriptional regulator [Acetobacterium carbinolicum]|uniref:LysR family transcriptional regulator n=1 Tax=Acetobacterium carbinolicum TaxID=52690 RepID=UPI0039C9C90D